MDLFFSKIKRKKATEIAKKLLKKVGLEDRKGHRPVNFQEDRTRELLLQEHLVVSLQSCLGKAYR
jgi:ABC-type histidine transport system ATPase subunit